MPNPLYATSKFTVLAEVKACPPERLLSYVEATQQTGIQRNAPYLTRVVATLALHNSEELPLTQNTLSYATQYSTAMVSKAVNYLYRTGVVDRGGLKSDAGGQVVATVVPAARFSEQVDAIPVWREAVEEERNERKIAGIAEELGTDRNGALQALIAPYEASSSPIEQ